MTGLCEALFSRTGFYVSRGINYRPRNLTGLKIGLFYISILLTLIISFVFFIAFCSI